MKRILITLVSSGFVLAAGLNTAVAQDDDDDSAAAVEVFTCNYADGKGPADLDAVIDKWNDWADDNGYEDYSAWTLTPFYAGPDQEFDVIWMGVTETGQGMGVVQDKWIANGGEMGAEFDAVAPCDSHGMFAALQFKDPPDREDPSSVVIAFRDCTINDGKSFADDVAPAIAAWSEFRSSHGSTAGMWVFFPVFGGGGEEYDYKAVTSHANYAEKGADFDNYDPDKAREIFSGTGDCDSARVYNATNVRMAESDDE